MAAAKFQRFVVNSAVVGGVMFCGWVMMKALTPTKEQMMERLSLDPDEYMSAQKKRNAQLFATIQQHIDSPDPVWKIKPLQLEGQSNLKEENTSN